MYEFFTNFTGIGLIAHLSHHHHHHQLSPSVYIASRTLPQHFSPLSTLSTTIINQLLLLLLPPINQRPHHNPNPLLHHHHQRRTKHAPS